MLRDLLILSLFAYFCYRTLKEPYIGVLLLLVITHMSPHRVSSWTYSYSMPLYLIAFVVTFVAFLMLKNKQAFPWHRLFTLVLLFTLWGAISTVFAMHVDWAMPEFDRSYKKLLGIILILYLCQGEKQIRLLVWVIVVSIGVFALKGGVFSVLTGLKYRVLGPPGGFIGGNNEFALACLMMIPLMFFLLVESKNKYLRWALLGTIALTFLSIIGSHSRGALVGLVAMSGFLWLKSQYKFPLAILGFVAILSLIPFIPEHWYERMETIKTYQQDGSAMGRINAWTVAVNVANERLSGGGYRFWGPLAFALYAPSPKDVHDAHSIYFEVLGELGYPGLLMYLMILWSWWRLASLNAKLASGHGHLKWCVTLSKMTQVSQIAYMSAGAFLGLAYWDLPYHLMAITILLNLHINKALAEPAPEPKAKSSGDNSVLA